jgi:hypothetical protein
MALPEAARPGIHGEDHAGPGARLLPRRVQLALCDVLDGGVEEVRTGPDRAGALRMGLGAHVPPQGVPLDEARPASPAGRRS